MNGSTFTYGIIGAIFFAMLAVAVAVWLFWLLLFGLVFVFVVFELVPYLWWRYRGWRWRRTQVRAR